MVLDGCAAILGDKPGKHFAENRVGVLHPGFFVELLEGKRDKIKKSINEGRTHIDDVILFLESHAMGDFKVGMLIGVGATRVVQDVGDIVGERIVSMWVRLTAGVVSIEDGVDCNVQKVHLL